MKKFLVLFLIFVFGCQVFDNQLKTVEFNDLKFKIPKNSQPTTEIEGAYKAFSDASNKITIAIYRDSAEGSIEKFADTTIFFAYYAPEDLQKNVSIKGSDTTVYIQLTDNETGT